jgi:DNA-binding transcriptional MerR regulator
VNDVAYLSYATISERADRDWVTSAELIAESGISYRQCDYWCRTNLLTTLDEDATPGSGHLRRFDEHQVARARHLAGLLAAGFSLQLCRQVIDDLLAHGQFDAGPFTVTIRNQSGDTAA